MLVQWCINLQISSSEKEFINLRHSIKGTAANSLLPHGSPFGFLYFDKLARFGRFIKNTFWGHHFCCQGSQFGPHFTQNWDPITNNLGPHSMWEQCLSHGVNFWVRCASGNVYMYTWDQAKICFDHYRCTKSLGALQESRSQVLVYGPSNFVLALRASLTLSFKPFGRSGRVTHAPLDRDALHRDASHTVGIAHG